MVIAITAVPSHITEGAGFISKSSLVGKTFGWVSGLLFVMIAIAKINIPNVIAILLRNAIFPKYFKRKP